MKRLILLLALTSVFAKAELPQMTDNDEWLGYFVAWEERTYRYGFGSDGLGVLTSGKSKETHPGRGVKLKYMIQEQVKGKWITREPKGGKTVAWTSEAKMGVNPSKPVKAAVTVTGDHKVEFIQARAGGKIVVKPKFLEKKTKNPMRVVVRFYINKSGNYKRKDGMTDRDYKKMMKKALRSSSLQGIRKKDGKKATVKFFDTDIDVSSKDYFEEGATSFTVRNPGLGKGMELAQGSEKRGHFEVLAKNPLYNAFTIQWILDEKDAGEKDAYLSFAIK